MNIDSRRFNLRSAAGGYQVTDRKTGESRSCPSVPSARILATMHERKFDEGCENVLASGHWEG